MKIYNVVYDEVNNRRTDKDGFVVCSNCCIVSDKNNSVGARSSGRK